MNPNHPPLDHPPLYAVLDKYFPEMIMMELLTPGITRKTIANMVEEFADWLIPEELEPPVSNNEPWPQGYQLMSDSKWEQRQLLRQILLDEAQKAKE
jgi:hypothetical protein